MNLFATEAPRHRANGLGFSLCLCASVAIFAQEILVLPEFQRPTIHGEIVKPDQGGRRREILSPAMPQNGYLSMFLVVKLRQPGPYRLDVAMNPEDRLQADLFRVWFHKLESNGEYYPDALIPIQNTYLGAIPDPENRIEGQTAAVFWLDLWAPRRAQQEDEERVRVEVTLNAGGQVDTYPMEIRVLPISVPDQDALDADHNSYGADWLGQGPELFGRLHAYHRIFYEHRGIFHQLGYGHAGRVAPEFAPQLEGWGRRRRIASWDLYDRHYGPLLDGSAFGGARRGPQPIRYAYLPLNPEWPASFVHWGQPGYEAEFVSVVSEMERHFREKGWTRTRLEMFFNHKKRYKGFPWDGDEVRFARDNQYFRDYRALLDKAMPRDSPVQFVFRSDSSWSMERQFWDLRGVVNLWVLGGSILSFYPQAPALLKDRGDTVWFYGSAAGVTEPAWASVHYPLRAWMWGVDGYVLWLVTGWGADPWFRFNGGRETLVYPGERFGIDGPLPSVRLKIERNALQDLAMLKALETAMGRQKLRSEMARLTNNRKPDDWWTIPRPALADLPPEEWTNPDIDSAARPMRRVTEGLSSDWWPQIRRWIYEQTMEEADR